ncbi:MAG: hypothetical protein D3917_11530 [Candidatus Electrothrix sp. AX5]|nr:hypothetical protein [Candidatus Electrothrix sp. AX5]
MVNEGRSRSKRVSKKYLSLDGVMNVFIIMSITLYGFFRYKKVNRVTRRNITLKKYKVCFGPILIYLSVNDREKNDANA